MVGQVSSIASQLQRNQSRTGHGVSVSRALRRAYTDSATCLQLVRDLKKTEIVEWLQRLHKGFLEVANQSPIEISRELFFEHAQKTGCD